jgi:hypothetical protein
MTRVLTHWVSPVQGNGPQTVGEVIERMRVATPPGWLYRALIPTVYGDTWQADPSLSNTCGMELRPKDAADFRWIKDRFDEQSVMMGGWAVPRTLSFEEGYAHGSAGAVVDLMILDLEPYAGFLEKPFDKCPDDYIRGYQDACARRPWVSIVPQASGIETLGTAWGHWARFSVGLRPQCYFTDGASLDYPEPSMPYLSARMAKVNVKRRVVPIFPSRSKGDGHTDELLHLARADRDVWVLD